LGWEKKGFVDRKIQTYGNVFVVYRKQSRFQMDKGHNNHVQNERCDELAVMAHAKGTLLMHFMKMK
jgi:ribonuclease HI